MISKKFLTAFAPIAALTLSSCGYLSEGTYTGGMLLSDDTTRDVGAREHGLSIMKAGIWVDGRGCEHWIIDDGAEGYMSPRFVNGKPHCPSGNIPYTTKGFVRTLNFEDSDEAYARVGGVSLDTITSAIPTE